MGREDGFHHFRDRDPHFLVDIILGFSTLLQSPVIFFILLANLHTSFFCFLSHRLNQHGTA